MDDAFEHAVRLVEAVIFASAEPVAVSALARLVPMPFSAHEVLAMLRARCEGVHLVEVGRCRSFLATSVRPLSVSVRPLRVSAKAAPAGGRCVIVD